jgi:hypothetical protein
MLQQNFLVLSFYSLILINGSYVTSDSWNIEFPPYEKDIRDSAFFRIHFDPEISTYVLDLDSCRDSLIYRYKDIINKALLNFTPSDPKLFNQFPIGKLHVRESMTVPGEPQSRDPNWHIDENVAGAMSPDSTTILYDGLYQANNVADSCAILDQEFDLSIETPEDMEKFIETSTEIFMKPNQLYWMSEKTVHRAVALTDSVKRQFVLIALGVYLYETFRNDYLKITNPVYIL